MPSSETVDPEWKGLYRAGGISMPIVGLVYIYTFIALLFGLFPSLSSGEAALKNLAGQALFAQVTFGLGMLSDLFFVPAVLALYLALKGINRSAVLVAAAFLGVFLVLDLAVSTPNLLSLVTLSQNYAAATSDAQRAAYLVAANYIFAGFAVSLPIYSLLVPSIGILITGLVMLKGIFRRAVAYLGIATSILGIVGGLSIFVPALLILGLLSTPLEGIWFLLVGYRLYGLRRK